MKKQNDCNKLCSSFQKEVRYSLVRHQSILDVLSKFQETNARTNRAIIKAVTSCGCIQIHAEKQKIPEDISFSELKEYLDDHLEGQLCQNCQDIIEDELGKVMFYTSALCELLNLDFREILNKELNRIKTLGIYNLR
ncbi:hypothetical protein [Anoxybacter fermentans]|uniref:hypothetical protein n=1 Tax=Anoxybacter fermentans TaxID=1323375 RepID=UPI00196B5BB3|nr:hypothetical protein [Anoxybacter fermentans]